MIPKPKRSLARDGALSNGKSNKLSVLSSNSITKPKQSLIKPTLGVTFASTAGESPLSSPSDKENAIPNTYTSNQQQKEKRQQPQQQNEEQTKKQKQKPPSNQPLHQNDQVVSKSHPIPQQEIQNIEQHGKLASLPDKRKKHTSTMSVSVPTATTSAATLTNPLSTSKSSLQPIQRGSGSIFWRAQSPLSSTALSSSLTLATSASTSIPAPPTTIHNALSPNRSRLSILSPTRITDDQQSTLSKQNSIFSAISASSPGKQSITTSPGRNFASPSRQLSVFSNGGSSVKNPPQWSLEVVVNNNDNDQDTETFQPLPKVLPSVTKRKHPHHEAATTTTSFETPVKSMKRHSEPAQSLYGTISSSSSSSSSSSIYNTNLNNNDISTDKTSDAVLQQQAELNLINTLQHVLLDSTKNYDIQRFKQPIHSTKSSSTSTATTATATKPSSKVTSSVTLPKASTTTTTTPTAPTSISSFLELPSFNMLLEERHHTVTPYDAEIGQNHDVLTLYQREYQVSLYLLHKISGLLEKYVNHCEKRAEHNKPQDQELILPLKMVRYIATTLQLVQQNKSLVNNLLLKNSQRFDEKKDRKE